ncbi:hypothetical protein Pmani_010037 [Petrolisthes manimaculis]|uniref:Importin subunit alpha n=1 Tax=Petrolisthes manimaculis TaxID=1843537 RepID=A0AAE1UCA6_9EUCA|nr:hypothetical protein Pmani_010037 [Petrolisthes manimaculis]
MTPRGDLPRAHSHHKAHLGSDRSQQIPPSISRLSRSRAAGNSLHRDLESIRARRAKLEALTTSVRLPPLIPSDINGVYSSSAALTSTPPRTHTASKQRLHRLRKGKHPITSISPGGSARLHRPSSKLPSLIAKQMTPLPKIGPVAETSEQETKQTQGKPRNPTPSPSPAEPQPSHVTPSPISQEEEEKPNYFQIVQEMKGIENNVKITDPKNTVVAPRYTTAFGNDTDDANVIRINTGINKATSNDTKPNTGNILSDVTKLSATIKARTLLSTSSDVPIEEFLEAGILEAAKINLNKSSSFSPSPQMSQLSHSTWALSNIFRTPTWMLTNEEMTLAISVVKDICLSSENNEVLERALWCLVFMTSVDSTIQLVIDADILPLVTPHLKSPDQKVQTPAVKLAGNIVTATDAQIQSHINTGTQSVYNTVLSQTDAALEAGILAPIHNILKNSTVEKQRKYAAWVLSNIAAGTTQQVQKLLDEGVLLTLLDVISKDSNNVVKEAAWALTNLVPEWTTNQRKQFVDSGGVDSLASLIPRFQKESSLSTNLNEALEAIDTLLTEDSDNVNKIKDKIEEAIGLDILLELRTHNEATVVSTVDKLLFKHFPDLEE